MFCTTHRQFISSDKNPLYVLNDSDTQKSSRTAIESRKYQISIDFNDLNSVKSRKVLPYLEQYNFLVNAIKSSDLALLCDVILYFSQKDFRWKNFKIAPQKRNRKMFSSSCYLLLLL